MKMLHTIFKRSEHTIITMYILRELESGVNNEEITFSRMVEILNSIAGSKVDEWIRYSEDMERWHNKEYESIQDEGMSRPNKPGYFRANND